MSARIFTDRIIAYKKGNIYLAVSLEFDLLAEGNNIKEATDRLYDATKGYLQMCLQDNESDEEIYRPAPKKYQSMYELFLELSAKKRKKEEEKRQERLLRQREIQSAQRTYHSDTLCYA